MPDDKRFRDYKNHARTYITDAADVLNAIKDAPRWVVPALRGIRHPASSPVRLQKIGWNLLDDADGNEYVMDIANALVRIGENCHPYAYDMSDHDYDLFNDDWDQMAVFVKMYVTPVSCP